jgi:hypothetical protein
LLYTVAASLLGIIDRPIVGGLAIGFNLLVVVYCIVVKVCFKLKGIEYSLLAIQAINIINLFKNPDIYNSKSPEKEILAYIATIISFHANFILIRIVFQKKQTLIWIVSILPLLISMPYKVIGPKNFKENIPLIVTILLSFGTYICLHTTFYVKLDKI